MSAYEKFIGCALGRYKIPDIESKTRNVGVDNQKPSTRYVRGKKPRGPRRSNASFEFAPCHLSCFSGLRRSSNLRARKELHPTCCFAEDSRRNGPERTVGPSESESRELNECELKEGSGPTPPPLINHLTPLHIQISLSCSHRPAQCNHHLRR